MLSYKNLVDDATQQIYPQSDTPRIDAEVILQHTIGQSTSWLIAYGDSPATSEHIKAYYAAIARRSAGEPVAYIIGHRDFWTLSLDVNEHVLIPRPDTETLIESALERVTNTPTTQILDLGTGSGAIALSLAKECPLAHVTATDKHLKALNVAKSNAEKNDIGNVSFVQGRWFDAISNDRGFDLIASNPPYIEAGDAHLTKGDLRFEPSTALIADDQGLADLRELIKHAPNFLKENAHLIVEHGFNQAEAVLEMFSAQGFVEIELSKDLNMLPRCTRGKWPNKKPKSP